MNTEILIIQVCKIKLFCCLEKKNFRSFLNAEFKSASRNILSRQVYEKNGIKTP